MRFWVIKAGEPIPFLASESKDRFLRAGLMSLTLSARGHDVVRALKERLQDDDIGPPLQIQARRVGRSSRASATSAWCRTWRRTTSA